MYLRTHSSKLSKNETTEKDTLHLGLFEDNRITGAVSLQHVVVYVGSCIVV